VERLSAIEQRARKQSGDTTMYPAGQIARYILGEET
jgi:hypothetical protein